MDLLLIAIISGMAVGYITELLSKYIFPTFVKVGLTLPLATLSGWLLGIQDIRLVVVAPAAGFFALTVISLISRPVVVNNAGRR